MLELGRSASPVPAYANFGGRLKSMAKILDGTALAKEVRAEVAAGVEEMQQKHGVTPGLANHRLGFRIVEVIAAMRNSYELVIQTKGIHRFGGAGEQ